MFKKCLRMLVGWTYFWILTKNYSKIKQTMTKLTHSIFDKKIQEKKFKKLTEKGIDWFLPDILMNSGIWLAHRHTLLHPTKSGGLKCYLNPDDYFHAKK